MSLQHIPPFDKWPEPVRAFVIRCFGKGAGQSIHLNTTWLLVPELLAQEFQELVHGGLSDGAATRLLARKYELTPERMRKKLVELGLRGERRKRA